MRPTARQLPSFVPPMLLRRVPTLPATPGWIYEVKWDGYRMQALKSGTSVRLLSRNGADYTRRFADVAQAISRLKPHTLHLDGEAVWPDRPIGHLLRPLPSFPPHRIHSSEAVPSRYIQSDDPNGKTRKTHGPAEADVH